jgi:hypothetical protein
MSWLIGDIGEAELVRGSQVEHLGAQHVGAEVGSSA